MFQPLISLIYRFSPLSCVKTLAGQVVGTSSRRGKQRRTENQMISFAYLENAGADLYLADVDFGDSCG